MNEKTKTAGENLFYKGVDKRAVHVARLSQTSSWTGATDAEKDTDPTLPPYPFKNGETLLALSRRHNVGPFTRITTKRPHRFLDDNRPNCLRQRTFLWVYR